MRLLNQPETAIGLKPQYGNSVRHFLTWKESNPVNEDALRKYFISLRENYSPSTIRLSKTAIKHWILKTHKDKDDLQFRTNVEMLFKEIKVPKPELTIHESKILSSRELKSIKNQLLPRYALILEALYQSGARVSELLSIKLGNCRVLDNHIEAKIIGKNSKEGTLIMGKELFQKINQECQGSRFLFENSISKKPLTRQIVHRHLRVAGFAIGRGVYPHQLRHSRISHLLRLGKPLDGVSRFARHFDPGFTARAYGHNILSSQELIETSVL